MTDDGVDQLVSLADQLDLTDYEIESYVAVLEHGQLTPTQIAEQTSVPQPRVYDTVRSLHDRGLVDVQESRPITVLAIDPREGFESVQTRFSRALDTLSTLYQEPDRGVQAASLVQSRSTIRRYLFNMIDTAEYELVASLPWPIFETAREHLADLYSSGVRIDLVLTPADDVPSPSDYDYSTVAHSVRRRRGVSTPTIVSADGSLSMYTSHRAVTGDADDADLYGIIFNRSRLGFLATGFLDTIVWATAEPIFENENALPFPRKYATIRRAVNDMRRLSGDFQARVQGHDVVTGDLVEIEGPVKGIESDPNRVTAGMVVEHDGEEYEIGGQLAAHEDIEATEIEISRR
ncbi:MAG: TrmB family transcriptional regulator [Halanaeroarchaeum sp.]